MSKETKNKMMTEERFFSKVKDTFQGYAPEVPQSVYAAMRRKLWMSNFMRFDATRFNMWYLLIAAAGIATASLTMSNGKSIAQKADANTSELKIGSPIMLISNAATHSCCFSEKTNPSVCAETLKCDAKRTISQASSPMNEGLNQSEAEAAAVITTDNGTPASVLNLEIQNPVVDEATTHTHQKPEAKAGFGHIDPKDKVVMSLPVMKK
ncbi:MAG: hypothetical protein SH856_08745 [Flavobacteriales bacterium]|nr:hypothetical protein [Flavobacteriales bacterium]